MIACLAVLVGAGLPASGFIYGWAADRPQPELQDSAGIRGPFVDAPQAYPHEAHVFNGDLRAAAYDQTASEPQAPLPVGLRLTPNENRKPLLPQTAYWLDSVAQQAEAAGQMPAASGGFPALSFLADGAGWPPDTNGDTDGVVYIQTVNTSIGIYSVLPGAFGQELYRAPLDVFFTGPPGTPCDDHNRGDPIVLYDPYVQRWLVTDFAWDDQPDGYYQCLAVSQTSDPVAGGWYFYALRADTGDFENYLNDYPKLGAWHDGWYMTANMFEMVSPSRFGVRVWALDRSQMVQGLPLREVHFDLCTEADCASLLPAHDNLRQLPGVQPNYLLAVQPPDALWLWEFAPDFAAPASSTFTGPTVIPVAPFAVAGSVPQREAWISLDSLSPRLMMQLQYRHIQGQDALWANHTVSSSGVAGVRWYQIGDPGGAAQLLQQGTYQPDSLHRWMASLAVDQDGNLGVGYSVSSPDMYPAVRIAGRLAGETPGLLTQGEREILQGDVSQLATYRWGDYSAMTVAPDGCTFFYTTEYYAALTGTSNWQTWVTSFKYPSCGQEKGELTGLVRDQATQLPLADVPLELDNGETVFSLRSAADGSFGIILPSGVYTVTAGPLQPGYPLAANLSGVLAPANGSVYQVIDLQPFPALELDSVAWQESLVDSNQNGFPEPGESGFGLSFHLANTGAAASTGIQSNITAANPGIQLDSPVSAYPDIPPGQAADNTSPYAFSLDPLLACGTDLEIRQIVTDTLRTYVNDYSLRAAVPGALTTVFTQDSEKSFQLWKTGGVGSLWNIAVASGAPSPTRAWTDSPLGNYANNVNAYVYTPAYNLAGKRDVQLHFWTRYRLEPGYDFVFVEYSLDGGQTWAADPLAVLNGFASSWQERTVPAGVLDDQPQVALRFRLQSDVSVVYDGVWLDDIALQFAAFDCDYPVNIAPAAPVPLAPMAGELFVPYRADPVTLRWLPGASGAAEDGYRVYLDGNLAGDLPAAQTELALSLPPGAYTWTVQAYNGVGASPLPPDTLFWLPFLSILPVIFR